MRRKNFLGTAGLIFIGIVFGAILVSGFGWVRPSYGDVKIGADKPPVEKLSADISAFNEAFIQVADKVNPSIVQITVVTSTKNNTPQGFHFFFPFEDNTPKEQQGGGSGIIISDDGYILTNNHVVEDSKSVTVTLHDKREFEATVIGTDPLTDLAVIKIDATKLPAAYLGDSDKLRVGQWVMAIGNPLTLTSTVTAGIVSATNRKLQMQNDDSYSVRDYIQTDAVINPGNSGGALVDLNGAVIGVNSAIITDGLSPRYIGYGFAVPINLAKAVAQDLIADGKVNRGYIGVSIQEVDAATAKAVGLDEPKGVIIQQIVEGGAASKEDVQVGDIILKIDDREVNQPNELQSYVASRRAGSSVKLLIYRDGKKIERNVALKAKDEKESSSSSKNNLKGKKGKDVDSREINFDNLGFTARNMNESEIKDYKVKSGVLITDVKQFGRAFNQRLSEGMVIVAADKKEVNSVSELQSIIDSKKGGAVLLKIVDSQGTSILVGLDIPK